MPNSTTGCLLAREDLTLKPSLKQECRLEIHIATKKETAVTNGGAEKTSLNEC